MSELEGDLDFSTMKVSDLKKELKNRGLSVTGNKTELVERLQMSMMGSTENDIMAEATDLLEGGDDDIGEDAIAEALDSPEKEEKEPEKKNEPVVKKKVTIKRDTALPVVTPATPEPKSESIVSPTDKSAEKPKIEAPKADETVKPTVAAASTVAAKAPTAKSDESAENGSTEEKPISAMTDAEKVALRAQRFGVGKEDEKKIQRAQRFGIPVTSPADNGKVGAAPKPDLDTLKKRAERFGQVTSKSMQQLENEEKIRKRQERFGEVKNGGGPPAKKIAIEVNKSLIAPKVDPDTAEKLKKRAERFAAAAKS